MRTNLTNITERIKFLLKYKPLMRPLIIVHAGTESTIKQLPGTQKAAELGWRVLTKTNNILDSVETAVRCLEDNDLFDAGTGSYLRLDGSIEMDAVIMDSDGNCGAVGAIKDVKNPVSVARRVMERSPHVLLVGSGAIEFARRERFEVYDPRTKRAVDKSRRMRKKLLAGELEKWATNWQYYKTSDTVGAMVRSSKGKFAAASSTGGTPWQLKGRVGDTPIIGAGIFVGDLGAVITSGIGEEIIRKVLAKSVYDKLDSKSAQEACEYGLALCNKQLPIGVIAIDHDSFGVASNKKTVYTVLE